MITKTVRVNAKEVFFLGCLHIGNINHDYECLSNALQCIKGKPYYLMGDLIEAISPLDKRFALSNHQMSMMAQVDEVVKLFVSRKESCLGMISGNHEDTPSSHMGDLTESMAQRLSVPYLTDSSIQQLVMPGGEFQMFLGHPCLTSSASAGTSAEQEMTKRRALRRKIDRVMSPKIQCRVIFHLHQGIVDPPHSFHEPHLGYKDGKLSAEYDVDVPNWTISGPSMFRTYTNIPNYASRRFYPPTDIGWMSIVVDGKGVVRAARQYKANGKIKQEWEPEVVK